MAGLAALLSSSAAAGSTRVQSPPAGWLTFRPGLTVRFALPPGWHDETGLQAQVASFYAAPSDQQASVSLSVSSFASTWEPFVAQLYVAARSVYRIEDPAARIRSRTVRLPGGRAFELIVSLVGPHTSTSSPETIEDYEFLHGGSDYDFEYTCAGGTISTCIPLAEASARSILFT